MPELCERIVCSGGGAIGAEEYSGIVDSKRGLGCNQGYYLMSKSVELTSNLGGGTCHLYGLNTFLHIRSSQRPRC